MASSTYGDLSHRSSSPSIPWKPSSDEKHTRDPPFRNPLLPPVQDEPLVSSSYNEDPFSSTTTVEGYSSNGSFTSIASDDGFPYSGFIAGNHTKWEAAPVVTEVKKNSFENRSPSGTPDLNSGSKFKFLNRSSPSVVSPLKRPSRHQFFANEDTPPSPGPIPPLGTPASSIDLSSADMLTLPSIWLTAPTPKQPGFSSPIADEPPPPFANSLPSPIMLYKPNISEVTRTSCYLKKDTILAVSQRRSVIGTFVRRLGNAIGFKREPKQSHRRHGDVCDKSGVEKKSYQLSPRLRTYTSDTVPNARSITTTQTAGQQPDLWIAKFRASEVTTDGEARQPFEIGRQNRTPSTGAGGVIDLEGIVTEFVRAEDTKRSETGPSVGGGGQGSGSEPSSSPVYI